MKHFIHVHIYVCAEIFKHTYIFMFEWPISVHIYEDRTLTT